MVGALARNDGMVALIQDGQRGVNGSTNCFSAQETYDSLVVINSFTTLLGPDAMFPAARGGRTGFVEDMLSAALQDLGSRTAVRQGGPAHPSMAARFWQMESPVLGPQAPTNDAGRKVGKEHKDEEDKEANAEDDAKDPE
ncbi:hypothetical protein Q8F55_005243 [Vanrija albida]|uniref:Uncharacterized protein n=1 Tax=Vanrija albida TaxID=181172 RepID=A0ABR3Q131_9TREE